MSDSNSNPQPSARADASRYPFLVVIIGAFWLLSGAVTARAKRRDIEREWNWLDLLAVGLASYRVGRVTALDEVTQPLRAPFVEVEFRDGERYEKRLYAGWRGAISGLLTCPDCSGFWAAGLLSYALILFPRPVRAIVMALAASGLGQFLNAYIEQSEAQVKAQKSDSDQ